MTPLGLIEGFYGPPWSWDARLGMADRLGQLGFELFVHAPKDDALHRSLWREPYLAEDVDRFARLAARCRSAGVQLVVGLSPLAARFADGADAERAIAKLAPLGAAGIRGFAILFDDMPPEFVDRADAERFTSLAAAQAAMANRVRAGLRERTAVDRFLFCPLEYCGAGDSAYLRTLGATLAADIDVFWTGPEVCSETIAASDVAAVSAALRRPPLIWDNYPVNDGGMAGDLRLRPVRGRAADLPGAVRGVVANGAIQAEATAVALHSLRCWADDPAGYDADAAAARALRFVADEPDDIDALLVLGDLARRSPVERTDRTRFTAFADGFWTLWDAGRRDAALDRARGEAAMLRAAVLRLERLANRRLADEAAPWVRRLAAWTDAFEAALAVLAAPSSDCRATAIAALDRAAAGAARVGDRGFEAWIRRALRTAGTDG